MSSLGEQFRSAREAQSLTLQDIAEATKIKTDHVIALEEGNYEIFSAPVYVRGFVRTYATMLKLDVPKVLSSLDGELSKSDKFKQPPSLLPERKGILDVVMLQLSKLNWRVLLPLLGAALIVFLAFVGYRAWRHAQRNDPVTNLGPGLYSPKGQNTETLPLPTNTPQR